MSDAPLLPVLAGLPTDSYDSYRPQDAGPLDSLLTGGQQGFYDIEDEQERKRFMLRVRSDLALAMGRKAALNERAVLWRKTLALEPKSPPYQDAPDLTMPLTRTKRDGVVAHLTDALDVEPFFSAEGYTAEAMAVLPVYESLMERELNAGDGRMQYLMALREAVDVGTGVIGWSLAYNAAGEAVIQEQLTRFENFFAYPVAVDDLTNCSTFRRYKEPWFLLKRMADQGLLNPEMVERLRIAGDGGPALVREEERDGTQDGDFSEEQQLHLLYECYCRWNGELWHVRYSDRVPEALSIKRSPFRDAFDAPPYQLIRTMRAPSYLWGTSLPQLLEAIQKIFDFAENSRIAYNQFAIAPVVQVDRMSGIGRSLENGGLVPGKVIYTPGPPDMAGVQPVVMPKPDLTLEEMELAQRFADMATFNDFQVAGDPFASGRRTATEVRTSFNIGTLKLRSMLRDVREDLSRAAKMRWALIELFRVRPHGVMPVYREGEQFLISSDGVTRQELEAAFFEFAQQEGIPESDLMQLMMPGAFMNEYQLVEGAIPGMKRDDIRWRPNGGDIIPDKLAELQKMDGFAPYMNWLGAAQQDDRVWEFLKTRLLLMGRYDWKKYIGEAPKVRLAAQQYMALMQQLTEQSSQLANNGSQGV